VALRAEVKAVALPVYLEVGRKRVFACAIDWPGWSRSGKTEEAALAELLAYAPRYEVVVKSAGLSLPAGDLACDVRERIAGDATTDFGAPGKVPDEDREPLASADADRLIRLLQACWRIFDTVVAGAPSMLAKGPRGGGRDRDEVVRHVLAAEASYARQIGLRLREPSVDETAAVQSQREAIASALATSSSETKWPPRYLIRRMAWHVLDHAWEIEDKS
jgi:hypothetical protein